MIQSYTTHLTKDKYSYTTRYIGFHTYFKYSLTIKTLKQHYEAQMG